MRIKHLLRHLPVLGLLLLGGIQQAAAQEDESWYKNLVRQRAHQQNNRQSQASVAKQSTISQRTISPCDLSTNGDFESYRVAPSRTGNMGGQLTGQNAPDELNNWYSPTYGTPDYLSTDGTQIDVRPQDENGVTGSSTPYSGNGEIGLYSRQEFNDNGIERDRVAEYATQRLPNVLAGQYYAEMWVSLSHSKNPCNYGITNSFGMWFSGDNGFQTLSSRDFITLPTGAKTVFNTSPIGQNALNNGSLGTTTWQRISGQVSGNGEQYVTLGLFNSDRNNLVLLPGGTSGRFNTYTFVDAFQLYKIPTAGAAAAVSCGTQTIIGEGCAIPGASYSWTIQGSNAAPFATTLQTAVPGQSTTTTYVLTVKLPDNSTYASTVTITGTNQGPVYPRVAQDNPENWRNKNQAQFFILNRAPGVNYTINNIQFATPTVQPGATRTDFIVKGGGGSRGPVYYGYFTITATNSCGSITTDPIEVEYLIGTTPGARIANTEATTAYPNPTAEFLLLPEGTTGAILVDGRGRTVQQSDSHRSLDVRQLPTGLYNLQMMQNGKLVNQRIQVKH